MLPDRGPGLSTRPEQQPGWAIREWLKEAGNPIQASGTPASVTLTAASAIRMAVGSGSPTAALATPTVGSAILIAALAIPAVASPTHAADLGITAAAPA